MIKKVEKLKLEDMYKFLLWFFNGNKKPGFITNLHCRKNDSLILYIVSYGYKKRLEQAIKFHERLQLSNLPLVFTRNVNIESLSPNLEIITIENLKYVHFINLEQLFDNKIFIHSSSSVKCPNKDRAFTKKTPFFLVSIDLEMVTSSRGKEVGRVSILDNKGTVLYDKFIKSDYPVIDYCTEYSGLTEELLEDGITNKQMKDEICDIIGKDTVILGHGLDNDLAALEMHHTKIIDTSYVFINTESRRVSLKQLAKKYLKLKVHQGAHSSVEDARLCLELLSLKIQQLKSALNPDTDEIWLQAHIYNYNSCKELSKNFQNGFNICVTNGDDLKNNYKKQKDSLEMFFYESDGKIFINFN